MKSQIESAGVQLADIAAEKATGVGKPTKGLGVTSRVLSFSPG
jgi:hypothetical protein